MLQIFRLYLNQHPLLVFWISACVLALLQVMLGLQHFYFDAERYWESGRELVVDGHFSLLNHVTPRGILYPLVSYGLIEATGYLNLHEIITFKILNTVFVCWGLWFVVPNLVQKLTTKTLEVWQRLLLVFLFHFFWFRYVSCPLSDFLCLFLVLFGFSLLLNKQYSVWKLIVVGLICGFVFNTRPIFNTLLVAYPVFYFFQNKESVVCKLSGIFVMILFAVMISLPQAYINQKIWNSNTIFQPTDAYYQGQSLYLGQLRWGVYVQKYDTYVGDTLCYERAPVFYYRDKEKMKEVRAEAKQIESYPQYLQYLAAHPTLLLGYAKNLFNGLDIRYNTAYIYHIKPNLFFALFNYFCWFWILVIIILNRKSMPKSFAWWWMGGYFLITCLLSVPVAIEPRFLIAIHLTGYVLLVYWMAWLVQWILNLSAQHKLLMGLALIGFVMMCCVLSAQTYQQIEHTIHC